MSGAKNVVQRPGSTVWYARIEIPIDVRPVVKKAQLWKSLGTRDLREARLKALPVLTAWHAEFDDIRRRRQPTPEDLKAGVWAHYEAQLDGDRAERARMPTARDVDAARDKLQADIEAGKVNWSDDRLVQLNAALELLAMRDAPKVAKESREVRMATLRSHLATGETALIEWAADDFIQRERLIIDKPSLAYRDLCQRLQRAELQYLERASERDKGDWSGVPSDPAVAPADPTMGKKRARAGETIMELYDRFAVEKRATATDDTWNGNRKIVQLFAEFVGETSHISAVTRTAVRDWKHKLAEWPMKAADMKIFKGLSFRKIIEANTKAGKPVISNTTINKYLAAVGSFSEWLLQNEYIDADVMRGMYLAKIKKKASEGYSFSGDQLRSIFESPLFTRCAGDKQEHLPGDVQIRDWRYWMPWLALYSGARLGEMAQLLTKDIFQSHGVWVMHITELGDDDKSTKNAGSMRVVPIHTKLIELGFIKFHAAAMGNMSGRLFPELLRDARGYFGAASKFFNDYLRSTGVKVDKQTKFHSFRHTIADAFRNAGYMNDEFDILLGHTEATTTQTYGKIAEGNLALRVRIIEAVIYPSLEAGLRKLCD